MGGLYREEEVAPKAYLSYKLLVSSLFSSTILLLFFNLV
jgi:hypothetical protein